MLYLFILLSLLSFSSSLFSAVMNLNLGDTISYALDHSPQLDTAKRELSISQLEVENSFTHFLPKMDSSITHNWTSTPEVGFDRWRRGDKLNLTLTENLYDNGESYTRYQINQLRYKEKLVALQKIQNEVCKKVAYAFIQYRSSLKRLEIQKQHFEILSKQYEQTAKDYHGGVKTEESYLRFKADLYRAQLDLQYAENEVTEFLLTLKKELGDTSSMEKMGFNFHEVDEKKDLHRAFPLLKIEEFYDLRMASFQNQAQQLSSQLVKRNYWPQLNFKTELSYNHPTYLKGDPYMRKERFSGQAGIVLQWNIWDWGEKRREVDIALEQEKIVQNRARVEELNLVEEMEKLQVRIKLSQSNYRVSETLLGLEKKNFASIEGAYRSGKMTYLDYIKSLENYLSAQGRYYQSLYELKQQIISYRYYEGTLYDSYSKK